MVWYFCTDSYRNTAVQTWSVQTACKPTLTHPITARSPVCSLQPNISNISWLGFAADGVFYVLTGNTCAEVSLPRRSAGPPGDATSLGWTGAAVATGGAGAPQRILQQTAPNEAAVYIWLSNKESYAKQIWDVNRGLNEQNNGSKQQPLVQLRCRHIRFVSTITSLWQTAAVLHFRSDLWALLPSMFLPVATTRPVTERYLAFRSSPGGLCWSAVAVCCLLNRLWLNESEEIWPEPRLKHASNKQGLDYNRSEQKA